MSVSGEIIFGTDLVSPSGELVPISVTSSWEYQVRGVEYPGVKAPAALCVAAMIDLSDTLVTRPELIENARRINAANVGSGFETNPLMTEGKFKMGLTSAVRYLSHDTSGDIFYNFLVLGRLGRRGNSGGNQRFMFCRNMLDIEYGKEKIERYIYDNPEYSKYGDVYLSTFRNEFAKRKSASNAKTQCAKAKIDKVIEPTINTKVSPIASGVSSSSGEMERAATTKLREANLEDRQALFDLLVGGDAGTGIRRLDLSSLARNNEFKCSPLLIDAVILRAMEVGYIEPHLQGETEVDNSGHVVLVRK